MVNEWARVHTLSILESVRFLDHWLGEICHDIALHHSLLCIVDASESDSLAATCLVGVPVDLGTTESHLSPLDVPSDGDVIHNSSCLCRVIPIVHSVCAHVLEREGSVEIFANVTTDVLREHELATWVIEVVLLHVDNEVINDGDLMA